MDQVMDKIVYINLDELSKYHFPFIQSHLCINVICDNSSSQILLNSSNLIKRFIL